MLLERGGSSRKNSKAVLIAVKSKANTDMGQQVNSSIDFKKLLLNRFGLFYDLFLRWSYCGACSAQIVSSGNLIHPNISPSVT